MSNTLGTILSENALDNRKQRGLWGHLDFCIWRHCQWLQCRLSR